MKPNFDIELLPEAIEFLENLDDKSREKFIIILQKAQMGEELSDFRIQGKK